MAKKTIVEVQLDNAIVPLHIIEEFRSSIRISIGRKYASLRIPYLISKSLKRKQIDKAIDWVKGTINNEPKIYQRFILKSYKTGDSVNYFGEEYSIIFVVSESLQKAQITKNNITLTIATNQSPTQIQKACQTLLSRILAKRVLIKFEKMVYYLNDKFFQKEINNIRLKYNKSNWGSCSGKGNLNFSTRLLFAPTPVINYVIIHELAHLIELNHSSNFWKLVKKACPDYKVHENWLKVNGHLCDF